MNRRYPYLLLLLATPVFALDTERCATQIVSDAVDHWRGLSSYSVMTMVIHRPDWERSMTMRAWTKGDERTLVRVIEPKKDRGNGTLTDDDTMWSFSPKVNRVIKVPSSMMGQSWMGSDFSNRDVARADDIIDQYEHSILSTEEVDGKTVYTIESIPHEDAAVVWGSEVLRIREDHVVLAHAFYDQDGELVKSLVSHEIADMGGRTIASRQRMTKADNPDEWTEIAVIEIEYELELKDSLFTLSNLRNPRE
ncbi:MAG: outer membrane lipoprotein-sorting protein [Gammaproteobacteria bacterium]|nr:outer membrane lipoprotein-sorting protein [Gammaproteobacteria bacterium]NNF50622.1 outer membrane lipoprotein-sorting protein [Woeseiaceae bacterium]MBT8094029.1 outer membrane lipoprotein-sorting protein [Gammaproteobacteria bacterium]MBT8105688.1 outer membrane lipoprotein-sorting protein [Gammaproteobacteria bacterium]NNK25702.1 outer membrane lipoprotein-sorting protein [Woeseiaceae bacterium]